MLSLPKILKKVVASFLVFLVLFFSTVSVTHAQASGTWYSSDFGSWYKKVYSGNEKDIFGERYTAAQVQWVIYGLWSFVLNAPLNGNTEVLNCLMNKEIGSCTDALTRALGAPEAIPTPTSGSIEHSPGLWQQVFSERPISAVTYFKDAARNIHLIPEVQAQTTPGFGFSALNPILELWKASRNIVYSLTVLIIIVLSFMIMFRVKLNPQTSITVQSAIPKVIIALILITFSYAIAGLLIDLMYVVLGLISIAFANSGLWNGAAQPQSAVAFFNLMTQGPAIGDARLGIFGFMTRFFGGFVVAMVMLFFSANNIFLILGSIIGIVLAILSVIILFINGIRVVWILFKALAQILLSVIVAPFQILLGVVIPNIGFGSWMRSYIANLAVFPVVSILFVLASYFLTLAIGTLWKGFPIVGDAWFLEGLNNLILGKTSELSYWPPLLGSNDSNTNIALIYLGTSFVMITIIPKTVDLIQSIIKGGQFNFGSAIGESVVAPFSTIGNLAIFSQKAGEALGKLPIRGGGVPKPAKPVKNVVPGSGGS